MKFRYNIFNFITGIMFVLAFLCIMISYATFFMYYPAMVFFEAGFVMLSITLLKSAVSKNDDYAQREETIVMELASGENGDAYVMQEEKLSKKKKGKKRNAQFERFVPSILCMLAAVLFLYLLISTIITHI